MCSARSSVSVMGSKQGGVRPTLAVQNDAGNRYSDVSIAVTILNRTKRICPRRLGSKAGTGGLSRNSVVRMEQVRAGEAPSARRAERLSRTSSAR